MRFDGENCAGMGSVSYAMPGELLSPEDKVFFHMNFSLFHLYSITMRLDEYFIFVVTSPPSSCSLQQAIGINIAQCVRMLGTAGVLKVILHQALVRLQMQKPKTLPSTDQLTIKQIKIPNAKKYQVEVEA